MKNNILMLITGFFIMHSAIVAQNIKQKVETTKSEVLTIKRAKGMPLFFSGANGEFYLINNEPGKEKNISLFDKKLNVIKQVPFDTDFNGKKSDIEEVFYLNNKVYLITSFKDKKLKKIILELRNFDSKSLRLSNNVQLLSEVDYAEDSKAKSTGFKVQFSPNQNYLMVSEWDSRRSGLFSKQEELSQLPVSIINTADMSVNWSSTIRFELSDDPEDLTQVLVTNEGDLITLTKRYNEKRKDRVKGAPNYDYFLNQYNKQGKIDKSHVLALKNFFISDIRIAENDDQNIICTGFYTKDKGIQGSYYLLLDKNTKSVIKESLKEFELNFLTEYTSKKQTKKATKKKEKGETLSLDRYVMSDIIIKDDGGVIQVAENKYAVTTTSTTSSGMTTSVTKYYNNTLIVISITPNGEIEWARKIPKFQVAVESWNMYSSYDLKIINNKMYFFFKDNPKNILAKTYKDYKPAFMNKKSVLKVYEVEKEGFIKNDELAEEKREKMYFVPTYTIKTEDEGVIMLAVKGSKMRFYRFDISEK